MRVRTSRKVSQLLTAALFVLPGLLLFGTFIVGPMVYSFRISFYDWKIINPAESTWVGTAHAPPCSA